MHAGMGNSGHEGWATDGPNAVDVNEQCSALHPPPVRFLSPQEPERYRVGFRSLWKGKTVCPFRNTTLGADKKRRDGKRAKRLSPGQLQKREVQRAAALQQRPGLVMLDFSQGKERVVRRSTPSSSTAGVLLASALRLPLCQQRRALDALFCGLPLRSSLVLCAAARKKGASCAPPLQIPKLLSAPWLLLWSPGLLRLCFMPDIPFMHHPCNPAAAPRSCCLCSTRRATAAPRSHRRCGRRGEERRREGTHRRQFCTIL